MAEVSVIDTVDVLSVNVKPVVVAVVQTVPVPLNVQVPVPMLMARVLELEEEKFGVETLLFDVLNVPAVRVNVLAVVSVAPKVTVPAELMVTA